MYIVQCTCTGRWSLDERNRRVLRGVCLLRSGHRDDKERIDELRRDLDDTRQRHAADLERLTAEKRQVLDEKAQVLEEKAQVARELAALQEERGRWTRERLELEERLRRLQLTGKQLTAWSTAHR